MYIGFRVELATRIITDPATLAERYNATGSARIFDLYPDGRITAEKRDGMIIARGAEETRKRTQNTGGMVNFSLMVPIENDLTRVVQIVNILGNNRLIRERIKTFTDGRSTLNQIPELHMMKNAFERAEEHCPGIIVGGWYYAPEALWEEPKKK